MRPEPAAFWIRGLREINEVQHRAIGQLCKLLDADDERYPDDVIARVLIGEDDGQLLAAFERTMGR